MIDWVRVGLGEYRSRDGRFLILKTCDREYGNLWILQDMYEPDCSKGRYQAFSYNGCKVAAERIVCTKKHR